MVLQLKVPNYIGGKFVESEASAIIDVINPVSLCAVGFIILHSNSVNAYCQDHLWIYTV